MIYKARSLKANCAILYIFVGLISIFVFLCVLYSNEGSINFSLLTFLIEDEQVQDF